jgi:hypothetical protein
MPNTYVALSNDTRNTLLIKVAQGLDHGEWGTEPPDRIAPGGRIYQWESHSDGFLTGTEGWVRYYPVAASDNIVIPSPVPDAETIYIHWDNPFVGSNSYDTTAPNPYQLTQTGNQMGGQAAVSYSLGGVNGPNTCLPGFVWRNAYPGDAVCVTPQSRDQAASDNSAAPSRVDPNGPYGPNSCIQPYVWRNAYDGDAVCVTADIRDQVAIENSQAQNTVV